MGPLDSLSFHHYRFAMETLRPAACIRNFWQPDGLEEPTVSVKEKFSGQQGISEI